MKDNCNKKQRRICMAVAVITAALVTGFAVKKKEAGMQRHIAEEVLRFHVLANSDGQEDQELKMAVKGDVIRYMKEDLPQSDSVEMTKAWARTHLKNIEEIAENRIREWGMDYPVKAEVTTCYFPEKTYGDVTFPKGEYEALRIKIGKAEGQNWWCVLYPNLCFMDAVHAVVPEQGKKQLRQVLEEEEYEMVTATSKFKVRWFFFQ